MVNSNNTALRRVVRVSRRQEASGWGPNYRPAICSTRSEAPSLSRASQLSSADLGRPLQALSAGERDATLLALYHPALLDLHEQKQLSNEPTIHPLQSHPLMSGRELPRLSGSLAIANRLGVLRHHPKVWVPPEKKLEHSEDGYWAPGFWFGDLLLFLHSEQGPYCVHWDVKQRTGQHDKAGPDIPLNRRTQAAMKARARHAVMCAYFDEGGIRTIPVAQSEIDKHVRANLRALFGWTRQHPRMSPEVKRYLLSRLRKAVSTGTLPIEVFSSAMKKWPVLFDDCKRFYCQAIWRRELRVNLFEPVLVDTPMYPERRDPLVEYASWFAR